MTDMIDRWSPNFDDRTSPVSIIVLHYTGMESGDAAIDWLANPASKVSSHYVVAEDGQIVRMVPEDKRAWHAGRSHWRGMSNLNSASIGIEIINPGHEFGYRPFPDPQVASIKTLSKPTRLKQRRAILQLFGYRLRDGPAKVK